MISDFTKQFPAFSAALGESNVRALVGATSKVELPAYRKLIRDRMPVDSIYFLMSGEVSVSVEEGGNQIPLGNIGPGQWLGEISVLSGEMLASSTVTTVTPVTLLRLKHQAFEDLLGRNEILAKAILGQLINIMSDRLRVSLNAGNIAVTAAEIETPPKRVGLLWALFGGSGG